MNTTSHLLPDNIKWFIVHEHNNGKKPYQIIDEVFQKFNRLIYDSTVSRILEKYERTGNVENAWSGGRPGLFTSGDKTKIVKEVRRKNTLTGVDVSRNPNLNVCDASTRTVQRLLLDRGLISSTNIPQSLNDKQKQARLNFCEEYSKKPDSFWQKALFSDESDIFPQKCGKARLRRHVGEEVDVDFGPMDKWDPRTNKAFGIISYNGVGPLVRYDGTIGSKTYTDLLQNNLLPNYNGLRGTRSRDSQRVYFHDQARAHTAKATQDWFKNSQVHGVFLPPRSPDINIIENCWSLLKDELFKKNKELKTKEDVWLAAQNIWYNKVDKLVPKLYGTIPMRLDKITESDGNRIKTSHS